MGLVGEPALEQLRKARKSEDPEIRRRTESLIKKIETESDNKKLIDPKENYHEACRMSPVTEVIADLVKQSGYRIVLEDKSRALETKKITRRNEGRFFLGSSANDIGEGKSGRSSRLAGRSGEPNQG